MHPNAKARIEAAEEAETEPDVRPSLIEYLPEEGNFYDNIKSSITKLCDDALASGQLSEEETTKIIWLKTRIELEMS